MDEIIPLSEIKNRVVKSFLTLGTRQILLRGIGFISINIILVKILPVSTLGVFNIGQAIITFFVYFSDVGLAASLIQKKEAVSSDDIKTSFTLQFLIVGILSSIIILSAPLLGQYYQLNNDGVWLIRILGFVFFLTSFKVLPTIMLERQLHFQPVALIEVIETVVFNGLLIYLAFSNYGIWAFSIAALSRGIVGVILIYVIAPIKLGVGLNKAVAKKLLSFGVPFQLKNLLALLKDRLVTLVVAGMVGPSGVSYITWSQAMAFLPLETVSIVSRVTFPAFARLQHDKEALTRAVEKSLFFSTLVAYPAIFGLGAIIPSFNQYILDSKMNMAILSFYLFSISTYWSVMSLTLTTVLDSTGHVSKTLKLMVMWTILEWLFTPFLTWKFGLIGVGLSTALISFTSTITIIMVRKILPIDLIKSITFPSLASLIMGAFVFGLCFYLVNDWVSLLIAIVVGGMIYSLLVFIFERERVINEIRSLRHA